MTHITSDEELTDVRYREYREKEFVYLQDKLLFNNDHIEIIR